MKPEGCVSADHAMGHSPDTPKAQDLEGVALLRLIFPELSVVELHKLHADRLRKSAERRHASMLEHHQPTSALGKRIWNQYLLLDGQDESEETGGNERPMQWRPVELPHGFLQLPPSVAVRRFNEKNGTWYYLLVSRLEEQVLEQHLAHQDFSGLPVEISANQSCYSTVVFRDMNTGLGMTLCEERGRVWVHSLLGRDGSRWCVAPPVSDDGTPAMVAGVLPGDWLLGINGQALLKRPPEGKTVLHDAVTAIQYSADPIVLHLRRVAADSQHPLFKTNGVQRALEGPSLLDMMSGETTSIEELKQAIIVVAPPPSIHPFMVELAAKGLLKSTDEQIKCTMRLQQFTERARQWESSSSFRLNARTYHLCSHFDRKDYLPNQHTENVGLANIDVENLPPYAPSTPTLDQATDFIPSDSVDSGNESSLLTDDDEPPSLQLNNLTIKERPPVRLNEVVIDQASHEVFPGQKRRIQRRARNDAGSNIFIPLMGIRKALCVRIVNAFMDDTRTAYTIWVFDVESGREWYAPVRYHRDFQDLRSVALPLCPSLAQLPFPLIAWSVFGRDKAETEETREAKCRQLEYFLRRLCSLLYTDALHPVISEIAMHLQTFLGCDSTGANLRLQTQITLNETMVRQMPEASHSVLQMKVRLLLKRSIQRYVYRLFLLEQLQKVVNDFVDATRERGPKLKDIEIIESQGRNKLKQRAMEDLERIQLFLDQIQSIIMEGCRSDFHSISRRPDFSALRPLVEGSQGDVYVDRIFREAVREQIEIEVYVPLRGVVSRLLVNGWRHDDMEIHFKMNELRKRPQSRLRIPPTNQSPSGWSSVSSILNEGVGMSTLPCAKLRAIVDSAKEISRVYNEEKSIGGNITNKLGADEFLPIFIYCVVQAEMERPCALCVLLRTLCDPSNRIGEVGYYLATFEAALTHIQEINLAEN